MSQTYTVTILHAGEEHTLTVPDDQFILNAAYAAGVDLPSSCCAGVCTTCAAKILNEDGVVNQEEAMGLGPELQAQKYVLLCKALARSDLRLESNKENEVYDRQFGQG